MDSSTDRAQLLSAYVEQLWLPVLYFERLSRAWVHFIPVQDEQSLHFGEYSIGSIQTRSIKCTSSIWRFLIYIQICIQSKSASTACLSQSVFLDDLCWWNAVVSVIYNNSFGTGAHVSALTGVINGCWLLMLRNSDQLKSGQVYLMTVM